MRQPTWGRIAPLMAILAVSAFPIVSSIDAGASREQTTHPPHSVRSAAAFDDNFPLTYSAERRARDLAEAQAAADAAAAARAQWVQSGSSRGGACAGDFECFKACTLNVESHGDYGAVSSGGTYRGAWQFDQGTWDSNAQAAGRPDLVGQDPATASPSDQDAVASSTYQSRGSQPWGGRC